MTEVVLIDERSGADSRRIWASLDADGSLVISGQDIGPKVERFFGTDEYEFSHKVPFACLKPFFALLGSAISKMYLTQFVSLVAVIMTSLRMP